MKESLILLNILLTVNFMHEFGFLYSDSYGADSTKVSVSGLSSGAYMAVQIHVAYSSDIMGVGVVAGGRNQTRDFFWSMDIIIN